MSELSQKLLDMHVQELLKLDYEMLLSIAKGEEPLTYSFVTEDGEHQIEVNFADFNEKEMDMIVSIDSDWKARFEEGSSNSIVHLVRQ